MIEKLNISEEQVEQLRELINGRNQARREQGRAQFELMQAALPAPANADANANANGNGGNNGGRGGRGGRGGNRINFGDPAVQDAMKAYMEKPEVKAKMAEFQSQREKQEAQLMAAVHRMLGKRQDANYGSCWVRRSISPRSGAARVEDRQERHPAIRRMRPRLIRTPKPHPASTMRNRLPSRLRPAPAQEGDPRCAAKTRRKSLAAERGLDE